MKSPLRGYTNVKWDAIRLLHYDKTIRTHKKYLTAEAATTKKKIEKNSIIFTLNLTYFVHWDSIQKKVQVIANCLVSIAHTLHH